MLLVPAMQYQDREVPYDDRRFQNVNAYYYELTQSMLLSWDSGQYQTTKEFDRLYVPESVKIAGESRVKLANDKNKIQKIASDTHEPIETDEGGLQYELELETASFGTSAKSGFHLITNGKVIAATQ